MPLFCARLVGSGEIEIKCRRCGEIRSIRFPAVNKAHSGRQSEVANVARR